MPGQRRAAGAQEKIKHRSGFLKWEPLIKIEPSLRAYTLSTDPNWLGLGKKFGAECDHRQYKNPFSRKFSMLNIPVYLDT